IPTKKNRPRIVRFGGHAGLVPCKEYADWVKQTVILAVILRRSLISQGLRLPLEGPLARCLRVYLFMRTTGDLSGYEQAVDDWLQHYEFIANDKLIKSHDGSRLLLDRQEPRLELMVTPYEMKPG